MAREASTILGEGELRLLERLSGILGSLDEPSAVLEQLMDLFLVAMEAERGLLIDFGKTGQPRPLVVRNFAPEVVEDVTAGWSRRALEEMAGGGQLVYTLTYGNRGMAAISKDFEKRMHAGTKVEDAVKVLGRNAVPLLYWSASNLGKWAKAKSFTTLLEHKDRIFKLVSRVHEVGPDYFHGAADRYFGAYHTKIPFPNGDLPTSKASFEASLKRAPGYIGTRVLYAEMYAIKAKDRDTFKTQLDQVMAYDVESMPEIKPECVAEKKKAAALLEEIDIYFPED